jgi:hypothetical protein
LTAIQGRSESGAYDSVSFNGAIPNISFKSSVDAVDRLCRMEVKVEVTMKVKVR